MQAQHDMVEAVRKGGGVVYYPELSNFCPKSVGKRCIVHSHVWVGNDVAIGNDCRIQAFAFIPNGVEIGDDVFIGPHVCFTNDKRPSSDGDWQQLTTVIEDGVSIGANCTILPGITLGEGCRIGAGSVVTKSVPRKETWMGNPAKVKCPTLRPGVDS